LNSLDFFEKEARLDSSLKHVLRNWASKQRPPHGMRGSLLDKAAAVEKRRRRILFLESDGPRQHRHGMSARSSLFYAPQISFAALWIHY